MQQRTGTPRGTRATWREWLINSWDFADDGSVGSVTLANGGDGDSFEGGKHHPVEYSPMANEDEGATLTMEKDRVRGRDVLAGVLVSVSAEPLIHGVECSTPGLISVVHGTAHARLALKRVRAVR